MVNKHYRKYHILHIKSWNVCYYCEDILIPEKSELGMGPLLHFRWPNPIQSGCPQLTSNPTNGENYICTIFESKAGSNLKKLSLFMVIPCWDNFGE